MKKSTVVFQIESEIRLRIASGFYAESKYLPSQKELAKEFATSQTTIANALDRIRQSGIIERKPRWGTRVIPASERSSKGSVGILLCPLTKEANLIIDGIIQGLEDNNQHYEIISLDLPLKRNYAKLADMLMDKYNGCIFVELPTDYSLALQMEKKKFPYVVANLESNLNFSGTWVDHAKTSFAAVHFLAAMGHRHILMLSGELNKVFYDKALDGYKKAMGELNIGFNESMIVAVGRYAIDGTEGYKAIKRYLKDKPLPSAIIACRDYLAWGAYRVLKERNVRVGHEVSIIGFDDITWLGEKSFLTTFAEPAWDLGYIAVEMLMERLIYGWKPVEKREVEASLILRRSVGPYIEP
jgi:DNA-binding LacI/PurR family transcriptional regulator